MTPGPGIARTPLPKGFTAGGINCGVRKYRPDLGLLLSEKDAVVAGVFTQNKCKAASVIYSQGILPSDHIRAIVTNSGQANTATGSRGWDDNWKMVLATAQAVGCLPHQVVAASTGVIGVPMAIDKIVNAIPSFPDRMGQSAESFALAILTTDLVPKTVTTTVQLRDGEVRITGICKGSGMIHPNMATMLGYLLTDAHLSSSLAKALLVEATRYSFNMISVDGDTSTNDAVFLMANGMSGVSVEDSADIAKFKKALIELSQILAQSIARDGEGATKLVEVSLKGASQEELARKAVRGLTLSPLVKSAIHGEDPNWGRVIARLGAEDIPMTCFEKMSISIQGTQVFENGLALTFDRLGLRTLLKSENVKIEIDLKDGDFHATGWGCDLSSKYVTINSEYST
jgi:glutamate N-acetyltransferase/amino-acid N-acetyltransferase